jgi:hypothetical protein
MVRRLKAATVIKLGAKYGSTEAKGFLGKIVPSPRRLGKSNFASEVTAEQIERANGMFPYGFFMGSD